MNIPTPNTLHRERGVQCTPNPSRQSSGAHVPLFVVATAAPVAQCSYSSVPFTSLFPCLLFPLSYHPHRFCTTHTVIHVLAPAALVPSSYLCSIKITVPLLPAGLAHTAVTLVYAAIIVTIIATDLEPTCRSPLASGTLFCNSHTRLCPPSAKLQLLHHPLIAPSMKLALRFLGLASDTDLVLLGVPSCTGSAMMFNNACVTTSAVVNLGGFSCKNYDASG